MKKIGLCKWLSIVAIGTIIGANANAREAFANTTTSGNDIECKVAIIGGGAAGMHTFYRLAPMLRSGLCLFEANDDFGGRIKDVDSPNGKGKWATGAVRVMSGQTVLFNLAAELGITLESADYSENRVFARGVFHSDTNAFLGANGPYPTVAVPTFPDWNCNDPAFGGNYPGCYSDSYYQQLFRPTPPPPGRSTIERYAPGALGGSEPFQFLKDSFRFRGDFLSSVDARSYIDFLREDWDACCTPSYPVGGMSAYIKRMLNGGKKFGARAFASEPVSSINKNGQKYAIKTSERNVIAERIVIAVPPVAFQKIGGTIANAIKSSNQFKDLKGVRVVTIENWWKSPGWWTILKGDAGNPIDRAWATASGGFTFNFIETPHSPYQTLQVATRSSYNDNPKVIQEWVDAYASGGTNAINTMLINQLNQMFPMAHISKSQITKTDFQDWPDAWYWLKDGTRFTNADIAIWALKPLANERISLASDAYNPNRTTWSDGAFKSSINTLNANYNLGLKCASVVPSGSGFKYIAFTDPEFDCPAVTAAVDAVGSSTFSHGKHPRKSSGKQKLTALNATSNPNKVN